MLSQNILVADDSTVIRQSLSKMLTDLGAQVTVALALLSKGLGCPDVDMPNMDGFGLCENLKKENTTRGIPVVILSSMDSEKDIEKGFRVGAAAYLSKSDALNEIPDIISHLNYHSYERSSSIKYS